MKHLALILLGAALSGGGGCAAPSAETGRNKSPPVVFTLLPTPKKAVASVRVGDEVRFELPAARGPEYVWQIVSNDPRCLRQSSNMVFSAGTAGAEGKSSVSFIAQRPSRSYVRFAYVPVASSKEAAAEDAYEILVTVRN